MTSSVASSTSTNAPPDPKSRRATLTATLRLLRRALRARPATEHCRSLPGEPAPDPRRQLSLLRSSAGLASPRSWTLQAASTDRVLVSAAADTDFGELLAIGSHPGLSVIILRRVPHRPDVQTELLLANVDSVEQSLAAGAVVILSAQHVASGCCRSVASNDDSRRKR